ncbi:Methylcrotonoyl-CoA carboxylase subunit alpha, mitochondrial [Cichlidogyrus casuarinus]|uniref:Methylcrotonoyl-CoA carboxylase subunit alpha, mitochondrial n=1 Tax=Cichlidogyrus casuarinus TaxID=1844966 RepID=A0ABD2Q7R6_9PLAT
MSVGKVSRILIANRGEIACRVIKTARRLGFETVSVYSEADYNSQHIKLADRAYCIGPAAAQASYLNIEKILEVAKSSECHAIHPGYGFLSESVEFATACHERDIIFIGPPANAIRDMGIKNKSKEIMEAANVPIIKGYHGQDQSDARLKEEAKKIGYPIMIKAVRGGGGKGMRIAETEQKFDEQLAAARREALKSFNDDKMLIEKYITGPRHVEVQVFGDQHGNYVYLWERDCSVQRRHQKVLEEAPALIRPEVRKAIGEAAVRAAKAVGYVGAGTVEFVMNAEQEFYFMEMNTRLQVEHPVSEAITQTDLVEWQLRVANGETLPIIEQSKVPLVGHAFEARLYAEDCSDPGNMLPAAGKLRYMRLPEASEAYKLADVRVDSAVQQGDEISVYYDPMIAKLVVWGPDRASALQRLSSALRGYQVAGLPTNIEFLKRLCEHEKVRAGTLDTNFIGDHLVDLVPRSAASHPAFGILAARCAAAITYTKNIKAIPFRVNSLHVGKSDFSLDGKQVKIELKCHRGMGHYSLRLGQEEVELRVSLREEHKKGPIADYYLEVEDNDGVKTKLRLVKDEQEGKMYVWDEFLDLHFTVQETKPKFLLDQESVAGSGGDPSKGISPMPGVIEKILVKVGQEVKKDQPLLTLIAMKMEYTIRAGGDGIVESISVEEGKTVNKNALLVSLKLH